MITPTRGRKPYPGADVLTSGVSCLQMITPTRGRKLFSAPHALPPQVVPSLQMITPTRGRKPSDDIPIPFLEEVFTDDNPDKGTETGV